MTNKRHSTAPGQRGNERVAEGSKEPDRSIDDKAEIILSAIKRLVEAGETEAASLTPYDEVTKNRGVLLYMDVSTDGDRVLAAVYARLGLDEQRGNATPIEGEGRVGLEGFETYEITTQDGVKLLETSGEVNQSSGLRALLLWGSVDQ